MNKIKKYFIVLINSRGMLRTGWAVAQVKILSIFFD